MEPIQIILALIVLFALSRAVLRLRDKEISTKEFAFWAAIWIAALIVIFAPGTAEYVSKLLGIGRPLDLIFALGIVVLFYLVFRIYVSMDNVKQQITTIIREVAIKRAKKKK